MIGSFWNLCRACPSMPVDKLHSEYRSTYRWHEYTGGHQEVVRRSPMPNAHQVHMQDTTTNIGDHICEKEQPIRTEQDGGPPEGSKFEPALPRRKKHPELAYRTHEIMACNSVAPRTHHYGGHPHNYTAQIHSDRARSEDRANNHSRPSRRSKSEGPPNALRQHRYPTLHYDHYDNYEDTAAGISSEKPGAGTTSNLFKQAISKISTEYRLQFAWPTITSKGADASKSTTTPRKSLSMNAIRATNAHYGPTNVHKRTGDVERTKDVNNYELEPLVNDHNDQDRSGVDDINTDLNQKQPDDQKHFLQMKEFKTEYKKKFRPFSQYEYLESEGRFTRRASVKRDDGTHAVNDIALDEVDADSPIPPPSQSGENAAPWYKEVIELRKKAGEYRHRGWGTELTGEHRSELYNKQIELWDQVSRRSSLSALSLAATTSHRSITKEEKEKENNNKSSPTKGLHSAPVRKFPGTARPVSDLKKQDDNKTASEIGTRSRKDAVPRHHFDRTTGAEEGVILTSPTREKLEPVIPKKRDDDHSIGSQRSSSQKSSPQKSSPQKSSPQKSSPQKARTKSSPRQARSQSVGPASLYSENRSPKRQSRSATATSKVSKAHTTPAAPQTTSADATSTGRRPRPTSLTTTAPSRSKCSSVPPTKGSGTDHHLRPLSQDRISKPRLKSEKSGPKSLNGLTANSNKTKGGSVIVKEPSEENKEKGTDTSTTNVIQSPAKQPDYEIEPVVKSPPEPTRVKSPEQILMRSPDPVNWTVPLDTGKTFTVTQNVREGELINRPHSEVKAWTPPDAPPPAPQSAPPELAQQAKLLACKQTEPAGVVRGSGTGSGWSGSGSVPVPGQGPGVAGGDASAIINGSHSEDTTTASSTSPNPAVVVPSSKTKVEVKDSDSSGFAVVSKPVAGTSLRCLEDPAFEQYYQRQHVGSSGSEAQLKESSAPYKVVEAPILESPTKPVLSPTSGRSLAADVLEKARNRFDRFWAKNKQDSKEGNV